MAVNTPRSRKEWEKVVRQLYKSIKSFFLKTIEAIKRQRIGEKLQNWKKSGKARKAQLIFSHWHKGFDGWQESVQKVYTGIEEEIKRRELPQVKTSRILYRQGGVFSAKREYLRIRRGEHIFDICAAPFGTGFFFSWWLGETPGFFWRLILWIPILGHLFMRIFRPETYYRIDTALMFQSAVHSVVLNVIEQLTEAKGIRGLSELEKKPILGDLFRKKLT